MAAKKKRKRKPKTYVLRVTVSHAMHEAIVAEAKRRDLTRKQLIHQVLRDEIVQVHLPFRKTAQG